MNQTRRVLANAFVITLAAGGSALAAGACTNNVDFDNPDDCPAVAPAEGSACDIAELACRYEIVCGDERRQARCEGGSWQVTIPPPCNPPPCPEFLPVSGGSCPEVGMHCSYDYSKGQCPPSTATCKENGWYTYTDGFCNPPPPCPTELPVNGASCEELLTPGGYPFGCKWEVDCVCGPNVAAGGCEFMTDGTGYVWDIILVDACQSPPQQCQTYGHETLCEADSGCRWLLPGCSSSDEAPPIAEGCYPVGDCDASSCDDWGSCITAVEDPCYQSNCNACGGEVTVCAPAG